MKSIITAMILAAVISGSAGAASLLIDGHKLKNHSVPVTKLTPSAVRSLHGQRGAQGVPGVQGVQGAQGVPGPPGLSGYVRVGGTSDPVAASGGQGSKFVGCPAGTQVLGGGYFPSGADLRTVASAFAFSDDGHNTPGWLVTMANGGGAPESFHVQVFCARVS
jgi:hypothetical protein